MAKRTLLRARSRARASSNASKRVRKAAPVTLPPARPRKRGGPIPGTPSPMRIVFAPEILADCRRRYEETPEPATEIARDLGVDETTIRRLAKREGWVKFSAPPRGLSPAVQLQRRAEALAERVSAASSEAGAVSSPFPPPERGRGRVGVVANSILAPTRPPSAGDLPLAGGGEEKRQGGGEENAAPPQPPALTNTVDELHAELRAQLAGVRALRERMMNEPQRPSDANKTAHTLNSLAATATALLRAQARLAPTGQKDDDDDVPQDLDELRDALARRIDAIYAEMEGAPADGPADGAGAAPA